jgi:hypothetical protein
MKVGQLYRAEFLFDIPASAPAFTPDDTELQRTTYYGISAGSNDITTGAGEGPSF